MEQGVQRLFLIGHWRLGIPSREENQAQQIRLRNMTYHRYTHKHIIEIS